jgi:hypothetical protein
LSRDLSSLKSTCDQFRSDIDEFTIILRLFPLRPEEPLNGIIFELTRKHCENVHDTGIVSMTSKSVSEGDVKNMLDLTSRSGFRSNDDAGEWACWEFRESLIRPTHYTIQSLKDGYPRSWVLLGSMKGEIWTELDRRKNDSHLKEDFAIHSYEVKSPLECRFVRLTETGKNHSDNRCLAFSSLEIFGSLRPTRSVCFPLDEAKSRDGIISYLTLKHGGNVHDKGIATISSKSVDDNPKYAVRNVADFTSRSYFHSKDEPGQWVCWDFHEMRVRPTHYTIKSFWLKSWVVESSLDFMNWTEIDRKTDNEDYETGWKTASYAVSNSAECRFIRLTQTDKNHIREDDLVIWSFEFFGTLLE